MFAPSPSRARVRRERWIPGGDAGVMITLREMRRLARRSTEDPLLRSMVGDIVADGWAGAAALRDLLAERFRFEMDPPGEELVRAPELLADDIRRAGVARGDCDDAAVLGAAWGLVLGYRVRYVVVAFGPWPYEHVWAELEAEPGQWVELDVTRPVQVPAGTKVVRRLTVGV